MSQDRKDPKSGGGQKADVQIITPPNLLKQKVSGSGGPTPDMLAKAEAAISQMSDDYPNWALVDVDRLGAMVAEAKPSDASGKEVLGEAFKLAHDMRGQGGSFGYPLMTRIANSFCRFIEALDNVDAGALEICDAHVKSMRAVLQNRVKGDGGTLGAQIADGLETAVQRYKAKRGA
jgi:hypothetical protein